MNSISLDFFNQCVCVMSEGQQGTMCEPDLQKDIFLSFIPDKYRQHQSYTWNFENETFAVNYDYHLRDGAIMTKDCFIPQVIIPMRGLKKRYREFLTLLNYEEFNTQDLFAELPSDLRDLFGF